MRLIDADKAYDYLTKCSEENELKALKGGRRNGKMFDCGVERGYKWSAMAIKDMPTVDAVPVVRCKNCKKYRPIFKQALPLLGTCDICGLMRETDYCSMGERKEE